MNEKKRSLIFLREMKEYIYYLETKRKYNIVIGCFLVLAGFLGLFVLASSQDILAQTFTIIMFTFVGINLLGVNMLSIEINRMNFEIKKFKTRW